MSGTFVVPAGKSSVRVLAVGGGGGGAGENYYGGGGSGFVSGGTFTVIPASEYQVTVGSGGRGGYLNSAGSYIHATSGGPSRFGLLVTPDGGSGWRFDAGQNGGSGGGAGYSQLNFDPCPTGGTGGSGGSAGGDCSIAGGSGTGQGSFDYTFIIFTRFPFTAGDGGRRALCIQTDGYYVSFGGGGGGVVMNGEGPIAQDGLGTLCSGRGGKGYGAGGGAGGRNAESVNTYSGIIGGNGAAGLVYIEWN